MKLWIIPRIYTERHNFFDIAKRENIVKNKILYQMSLLYQEKHFPNNKKLL